MIRGIRSMSDNNNLWVAVRVPKAVERVEAVLAVL